MFYDLVGRWRLISYLERRPGDTQWINAIGEAVAGYLTYHPDGYMSVMIGGETQLRLRGEWSEIPSDEKAKCLNRLVMYCGTYSTQGDHVRHHIEISWIPNWEGRTLVRRMIFEGVDKLILSTGDDVNGIDKPSQRLIWERITHAG